MTRAALTSLVLSVLVIPAAAHHGGGTFDSLREIKRSYTAEDPIYFRGQFTGSDVIGVADLPYKPDPCKELRFLDYSKETKK